MNFSAQYITNQDLIWKPIGKAENILSIAAYDKDLYALTETGDILQTKTPGKPKWKKEGTADKGATLLTVTSGKLFVTDGKGYSLECIFIRKTIYLG